MNTSAHITSLHAQLPQYTILVVDDNPINLERIVESLKEHGFKTIVTTSGRVALQKAKHLAPDLILLDVVMPGLDGFEVCRRLKAHESTRDIPVIFMTALTNTDDKVKAFGLGGVDYVTKPMQPEEVLARVNTHLSIRNLTLNLQEQTQELQSSLEKLRLTQEQLIQAEKMAALGSLVAGIAHELNTPVGIGVTAASYLEQETQELKQRHEMGRMTRSHLDHYLKVAEEAAVMILENMRRAADQIRSFKEIAVDQTSSEKRSFKLKAYIENLLISLQPKLKKTQHSVIISCSPDLEITSYPGVFSQIITNLILNSLMHGFAPESQGKITIEITSHQEALQIRYHDDGRGMKPEELQRIFEPFYTTKRGRGGTGLGLHIVYNLVTQKLGGHIDCESAPGSGTTFLIDIPFQSQPPRLRPKPG